MLGRVCSGGSFQPGDNHNNDDYHDDHDDHDDHYHHDHDCPWGRPAICLSGHCYQTPYPQRRS